MFANIFNYTCLNNSDFHLRKLFILPTKSFVQKSLKALFYQKKATSPNMFARSDTRTHFDMLILFAFRANFMLPCHPSAIAVTKVINSFQMELKVNLFNVDGKGFDLRWEFFFRPPTPLARDFEKFTRRKKSPRDPKSKLRRQKWLATVEGKSLELKHCLIRLKLLKIHFAPLPALMGSTLWILNLLSLKIQCKCQKRNGIHVSRNNFVANTINWRWTRKTSGKEIEIEEKP